MGRLNYAQAPALGVPTASPTDVSNQAASTAFVQALVPPGVVFPYAGPIPPTGWLLADGSAISRTVYARLFAAIGTTYGAGDGTTTFNLPELRGEFLRGLDNGRGVDAGRALGTAQADALQNITGSIMTTRSVFSTVGGSSGAFTLSDNSQVDWGGAGGSYNYRRADFDASKSPGARTAAETRARNVAMNFIIKAQ